MLRFLGICVLLVTGILTKTALGRCNLINESASPEDLASFLRSSLDLSDTQRDGACIEFALRHLEYKPAARNGELLVRYLDFKRPLSPAEREGFMLHGPMTESNLYPAIGTLSTFATAAVPALLSAIADPTSDLTARNATHALMEVFRAKPTEGIEVLKRQAAVSPVGPALKLTKAAQAAVQWCYKQRSECEFALHTGTRQEL